MAELPIRFPPIPDPNPRLTMNSIALTLQEAWDSVEEYRLWVLDAVENDLQRATILRRLDEFQKSVEAFQAAVPEEAARFANLMAGEYAAGVHASAAALGTAVSWTMTHREAVMLLAADSYSDLLARSQDAGRTSARFARKVRQAARGTLPTQATGGTAVSAGREFRRVLEEQYRIGSVVYRDGSVHSVQEYTQMAARTKGRTAYNQGSLLNYGEAGVQYVQVFDGPSCGWTAHNDWLKANGRIVTLSEAQDWPISHPNCVRGFGARPDLSTASQAASAEPIIDSRWNEADADRFARVSEVRQAPAAAAGAERRAKLAEARARRAQNLT